MRQSLKMNARPLLLLLFILPLLTMAQKNNRARDLGIPFDGTPGKYNAITDVEGVQVGHTTLIEGSGPLQKGIGPVRTGVTAIFPAGKKYTPVFANWYSLNGNGDMTGTHWITESGFLETPVLITNTSSVGSVRDAALAWMDKKNITTHRNTSSGIHIPWLRKRGMGF